MTNDITREVPVVFISYSHDSEEHKTWVRDFATALRNLGVDVILDQWEIGPGDDVPKFMEQSVRRALRVIMVCTEQYVRKADDGKGGAGYEVMIVTGELVADLGTKKFIPIIRQTSDSRTVPACVSTRFFVDFSDNDTFPHTLEELARSIHESPKFEKPPLGQSPFVAAAVEVLPVLIENDVAHTGMPYETYELSTAYASAGNFAKWHELIHKEKYSAEGTLLRWRSENEQNLPETRKELLAFFLPAVATYGGLFGAAFGAFDSTNERFHNQLSLLDWIRNPKGWQRSGITVWADLPELVLFTYQALLGALAMSRLRPESALRLATTPISDRYQSRESQPLFKDSRLVGWPESLDHHCNIGWAFLQQVAREWEWLWKIFGSEEDTVVAIVSYYLFLNTVDFVSATKTKAETEEQLRGLEAPLFCMTTRGDLDNRIRGIFFGSANFIATMFSENGITEGLLPGLWNLWMAQCEQWLSSVHPDRWPRRLHCPHHDLPEMLNRGSEKHRID